MAGSRFLSGYGVVPVYNPGDNGSQNFEPGPVTTRIYVLYLANLLSLFAIFVMMNFLTNVWNLSITQAAAIINIFYGITQTLIIVFAFLVDAFLGDFYMLLLSSIAYSIGLGLLSLSTPTFFGPCSDYKEECIRHIQKVLYFTALPLIAVGMAGHEVSLSSFLDLQDKAPAAAEAEAQTQAPAEAQTQAQAQAEVEALDEAKAQTQTQTQALAVAPAEAEAEVEALDEDEAQTQTQAPAVALAEAQTQPQAQAEVKALDEAEAQTQTQAPAVAPAEAEAQTQTQAQAQAEAEALDEAEAQTQTQTQARVQDSADRILLLLMMTMLVIICAGIALPYIKPWSIRFGIPAICALTATVLFLTGSLRYKHSKPEGSPLTIALRVFVAAATKDFQQVTNFKQIYNDDDAHSTSSLRWLDKAAIKFPDQAKSRSWTLCTVREVEDTKTVETQRLHVIKNHGLLNKSNERIPMSVFVLLPQFLLLGAAEGITYSGIEHFLRGHVPETMYEYMCYFRMFVSGLGSMANVLWVYVVGKVSERNNDTNWFQHTSNRSRLDLYYWTLAGLGVVNVVIYTIVASFYKYDDDDEDAQGRQ
ncbi:hypothetical protein L1987_84905 [Smallanthus sonchifolius]|uniref:Uncharacterized protein n=1 Tax=Smallanthus sonchifolius TaxID=185202 RepID=A0ACB8XV82_9ASTR|nr:hypothetical protein L1987_84905 [Smallanthus sonchifolius]